MAELKHSEILRKGDTEPSYNFETNTCSAIANRHLTSVDVTFRIKSKGGGYTRILVRIGVDDLPTILESLATSMPECVTMLSEAATVAEKHLLDKIEQVTHKLKQVQMTQVQKIVPTGSFPNLMGAETLHQITCSVCEGPPQFHPDGVVVRCIYCGALLKAVGV